MINIRETEESVLIEANDFNMPVQNLYNEILVRGKTMPEHEVRAFTSRIIGSSASSRSDTWVCWAKRWSAGSRA